MISTESHALSNAQELQQERCSFSCNNTITCLYRIESKRRQQAHTHTCTHVRIKYVYTLSGIYIYNICTYIYIYIHIYIYIYAIYVRICIYVYIYIYACVYIRGEIIEKRPARRGGEHVQPHEPFHLGLHRGDRLRR